jgi:hypothetical protein
MVRTHPFPRALAGALAITAVAAQVAVAQPRDFGPPGAEHAAAQSPRQDLRSPDAKSAAAPSPQPRQDLRSPDAKSAAAPSPQPRQDLRSPDAKPAPLRQPARPVTGGGSDGTPWALFGLGIAGACVALGGTAGIAGRSRRTRRARVTA